MELPDLTRRREQGLNILDQAIKNDWQDVATLFVQVVQPLNSSHPDVRSTRGCINLSFVEKNFAKEN